ncbi:MULTISPECIES: restriction endonuclease subunit S [unclassified Pseudoalteromonas]|uniref:restriction endonuclease subunit S n=1 Tax=unclassified Pseudoalteromonas TaxID=194690 RepID=UPI003863A8DE
MGSDWKSGKLGDYVSSCLGKMLDKKKNKGDYQPYLGNSNVRWGYFELDNLSEMKFEPHELNRYSLKKGDLIVCEGGEPGRCAIWEEDVPTMMIQKALHRIRPFNELDSKYLFYWFLNAGRAGRLDPFFTGTTIKHLTGKALSQLPIDIPPMEHQRYSVNILSSLDDKIQLNKKTNQTLEQMAQALFKSWFVDFDPVFDNLLASVDFNLENLETSLPDELKQKAQRRLVALNSLENAAEIKTSLSALAHELQAQLPTKEATQAAEQVSEKAAETPVKANLNANPNILAQHANTDAHFPNEFEHNEQLGWIPKGWEVLPLESLIILIGGGTPKTSVEEYWNGDIPWFSVVDAPQDSDVFVVDTEKHVTQLGVDKSSTKILRVGTTIISARGTVGKCAFVGTPMAMNQSCYGINGINNISDEFIYYLTRHQVSDLQKRGHGSVFNTITRETFKSILLPFSGDKLTKEFGKAVTSLFDKILMNNRQNVELIKLRDTLLPKLISGELQIPDVATDDETVY